MSNQLGKKEITLTAELMSQFSEADPVLHQRYRIGDKLMMCGTCHRVIRSELVSGAQCPYDSRHTFNSVAVLEEEATIKIGRKNSTSKSNTNTTTKKKTGVDFAYLVMGAAFVAILYCNQSGVNTKYLAYFTTLMERQWNNIYQKFMWISTNEEVIPTIITNVQILFHAIFG